MASKRAVRLTSEQVLEAILNSDEDQSDLGSLSDDFSSDESCLGDVIDEEGNEIDLGSLPTVGQHCLPDPCNRDSLLIGNVSTYLFCVVFYNPTTLLIKRFSSIYSINASVSFCFLCKCFKFLSQNSKNETVFLHFTQVDIDDECIAESDSETQDDNTEEHVIASSSIPDSQYDVAGPSTRGKEKANKRYPKRKRKQTIPIVDSDFDVTDDESIPTSRHHTSPASKQSLTKLGSKTRTSFEPTKNGKSKVKNVKKTTKKKVTRKKNVMARTTKPNKNDEANRLWENVDETFLHPNANTHFVEYVGLKRPAYQADSPLECLRLFLTVEVLNQIVTETNRYRAQQNAAKPSLLPWHDLTVEELLAFFAIILAMGLIKLPELELYWRRNSIFEMHWFTLL